MDIYLSIWHVKDLKTLKAYLASLKSYFTITQKGVEKKDNKDGRLPLHSA